MESVDIRGIWWLPANPDLQIPGRLQFTDEDWPLLELDGCFTGIEEIFSDSERPIILGIGVDGTRVTLVRCHLVGEQLNLPGLRTSRYSSTLLIVGGHFSSEDAICFPKYRAAFDRLPEWSRLSGFRRDLKSDDQKHMEEFTASYRFPPRGTVEVQGSKIGFHTEFNASGDWLTRGEMRQTLYLEIEPPAPMMYGEMFEGPLYLLQNFLSLGVGLPVYPERVVGVAQDIAGGGEAPGKPSKSVEMLYFIGKRKVTKRQLMPQEMLFSYGAIRDEFETCLTRWFERSELLRPILDLYFGTIYSPSMYLQHEFLSLAQAVESYHRRTVPGTYLDSAVFERVLFCLKCAISNPRLHIPAPARSALDGRFKYMNEYSLRRRLKDLLQDVQDLVAPAIPSVPSLVDSVVVTRNYLTHYDPDSEERSASGLQLKLLSESLRLLLEVLMLKEVGLDRDVIRSLVESNQRYAILRNGAREDA